MVCRAEACLCWFTNLCPGSVQDLASSGVSPSSWMPAIPSFRLICTLSPGRWSWAESELTIYGISFPCPLGHVAAFPIAPRAHSTPMAQPRSPAVYARVPLFTILEGAITALTCGPPPWSERSRRVIERWLDRFGPHVSQRTGWQQCHGIARRHKCTMFSSMRVRSVIDLHTHCSVPKSLRRCLRSLFPCFLPTLCSSHCRGPLSQVWQSAQ